jgi:2,5-diamino-6-(ribosylamino)-4(3H)-pyrimidinone 5'-phosphate reductase
MGNQTRPFTTLFLIESLDGKISTGDNDGLDFDKDLPSITGVREGLPQYYELERKSDLVSFNSGKVQAKVGVNHKDLSNVEKIPVSFVLVDNQPHLDENGCSYFALRSRTFYLVTNNKNHPVFSLKQRYDNIEILFYEGEIDFIDAFRRLKEDYGIEKMTVQTGGSLNAVLLRNNLIDKVQIVIAPCLIGGKDTSTLIDGESLHTEADLRHIKALQLINCQPLKENYALLEYRVVNENQIAAPEPIH